MMDDLHDSDLFSTLDTDFIDELVGMIHRCRSPSLRSEFRFLSQTPISTNRCRSPTLTPTSTGPLLDMSHHPTTPTNPRLSPPATSADRLLSQTPTSTNPCLPHTSESTNTYPSQIPASTTPRLSHTPESTTTYPSQIPTSTNPRVSRTSTDQHLSTAPTSTKPCLSQPPILTNPRLSHTPTPSPSPRSFCVSSTPAPEELTASASNREACPLPNIPHLDTLLSDDVALWRPAPGGCHHSADATRGRCPSSPGCLHPLQQICTYVPESPPAADALPLRPEQEQWLQQQQQQHQQEQRQQQQQEQQRQRQLQKQKQQQQKQRQQQQQERQRQQQQQKQLQQEQRQQQQQGQQRQRQQQQKQKQQQQEQRQQQPQEQQRRQQQQQHQPLQPPQKQQQVQNQQQLQLFHLQPQQESRQQQHQELQPQQHQQPKSQMNQPQFQMNQPQFQMNQPQSQIKQPQSQTNQPQSQMNQPQSQTNQPQSQTNQPQSQTNQPQSQTNQPQSQMKQQQPRINRQQRLHQLQQEACQERLAGQESRVPVRPHQGDVVDPPLKTHPLWDVNSGLGSGESPVCEPDLPHASDFLSVVPQQALDTVESPCSTGGALQRTANTGGFPSTVNTGGSACTVNTGGSQSSATGGMSQKAEDVRVSPVLSEIPLIPRKSSNPETSPFPNFKVHRDAATTADVPSASSGVLRGIVSPGGDPFASVTVLPGTENTMDDPFASIGVLRGTEKATDDSISVLRGTENTMDDPFASIGVLRGTEKATDDSISVLLGTENTTDDAISVLLGTENTIDDPFPSGNVLRGTVSPRDDSFETTSVLRGTENAMNDPFAPINILCGTENTTDSPISGLRGTENTTDDPFASSSCSRGGWENTSYFASCGNFPRGAATTTESAFPPRSVPDQALTTGASPSPSDSAGVSIALPSTHTGGSEFESGLLSHRAVTRACITERVQNFTFQSGVSSSIQRQRLQNLLQHQQLHHKEQLHTLQHPLSKGQHHRQHRHHRQQQLQQLHSLQLPLYEDQHQRQHQHRQQQQQHRKQHQRQKEKYRRLQLPLSTDQQGHQQQPQLQQQCQHHQGQHDKLQLPLSKVQHQTLQQRQRHQEQHDNVHFPLSTAHHHYHQHQRQQSRQEAEQEGKEEEQQLQRRQQHTAHRNHYHQRQLQQDAARRSCSKEEEWKRWLSPRALKSSSSSSSSSSEGSADGTVSVRLFRFLMDELERPEREEERLLAWVDRPSGLFRIVRKREVAAKWGRAKNNQSMTYEKFSRSLRYYYKIKQLERVHGQYLVYRFGPRAHPDIWNTITPSPTSLARHSPPTASSSSSSSSPSSLSSTRTTSSFSSGSPVPSCFTRSACTSSSNTTGSLKQLSALLGTVSSSAALGTNSSSSAHTACTTSSAPVCAAAFSVTSAETTEVPALEHKTTPSLVGETSLRTQSPASSASSPCGSILPFSVPNSSDFSFETSADSVSASAAIRWVPSLASHDLSPSYATSVSTRPSAELKSPPPANTAAAHTATAAEPFLPESEPTPSPAGCGLTVSPSASLQTTPRCSKVQRPRAARDSQVFCTDSPPPTGKRDASEDLGHSQTKKPCLSRPTFLHTTSNVSGSFLGHPVANSQPTTRLQSCRAESTAPSSFGAGAHAAKRELEAVGICDSGSRPHDSLSFLFSGSDKRTTGVDSEEASGFRDPGKACNSQSFLFSVSDKRTTGLDSKATKSEEASGFRDPEKAYNSLPFLFPGPGFNSARCSKGTTGSLGSTVKETAVGVGGGHDDAAPIRDSQSFLFSDSDKRADGFWDSTSVTRNVGSVGVYETTRRCTSQSPLFPDPPFSSADSAKKTDVSDLSPYTEACGFRSFAGTQGSENRPEGFFALNEKRSLHQAPATVMVTSASENPDIRRGILDTSPVLDEVLTDVSDIELDYVLTMSLPLAS